MSALLSVEFGRLEDDYAGAQWIYTDYGRMVVSPAKPSGSYRAAMPYLQNGFVLLQIAVQEASIPSVFQY
jgi:hypothetical protein